MSALDDLKAAGFSDEEVSTFATQKRDTLKAGGFSDDEVNAYLGAPAKQPDMLQGNKTFARSLWDRFSKALEEGADSPGGGRTLAKGLSEFGSAAARGGEAIAPDMTAKIEAGLNAGSGFLFGFPAQVAAGLGGLVTKHVLGMDMDPAALAEGISKAVTYTPQTKRGIQLTGQVNTPFELLGEGATWSGHKATDLLLKAGASDTAAAAGGAITEQTLGLLPMILLGELGRKMGGQRLDAKDMTNAAKVAVGPDAPPAAAAAAEASLHATYEKTGIGPYTVLDAAKKDPTILRDLADPTVDVPKALEQFVPKAEGEAAGPVPGDGAPLLDTSEPGGRVEPTMDAPAELPHPSERVDDLRAMGSAAYWAEQGGKMLRGPLEEGGGAEGPVVGRTRWIPAEEWFGDMRRSLGKGGLSGQKEIQAAIEKAIAGEKLTSREARTVDYIRAEAEDMRNRVGRYAPEAPELATAMMSEGLAPRDVPDAAQMRRAADIDPQGYIKASDDYDLSPGTEHDTEQFHAAIRAILANEDRRADAGRAGEPAAGASGEAQPSSAGFNARPGAGTLNAGINPAAVLGQIRDSYTPFVGVEQDHVRPPLVDSKGKPKSPLADNLLKVFSPASRGEAASMQSGIMRANLGEMARQREVALERLKETAAGFDKLPVAENIKFIDAMEKGTPIADKTLAKAAGELRALLDAKRDEVQALGTGKLENFDENYFPHIWKDADQGTLEAMYSRRPLAGSGAFLKQRTIPFTTDGLKWRAYDETGEFIRSFDTEAHAKLAAGPDGRVGKPLTPITTNPVELALLKAREMDRYIYGQRIFEEMKAADLARFVGFGERPPPGWTKINDKIARVYLPSDIPIHEAFDERMMGQLEAFAEDLGVTHERLVKIGGSRLGYASRSGNVVTKFGGPETVLTHELGHQLDFKYGLKEQFVNDKFAKKELRALADLRYEGSDAPESFKRYVRKGEEKMANMVHAFVHMPDRFREVAPNTYAKFTEFLDEHPELSRLREIKPSLVLGTRGDTVNAGGAVIAGEFHAPDEAATLINNHLSPGLQGNTFFDAWRGIGSMMNSAQLGLSLFHVGFTTMDSMISKVALGLKQISRGDIVEGAGNALQGVNPAQPFINLYKGDKLLQAYLGKIDSPELSPIVDAIQQAGGRVKMDDFYRNTNVNAFKQALRRASGAADAGDYKALLGASFDATKAFLPTVMDRVNAPIFEYLVPRQKLGVFFDMSKDWLAKNPDATVMEKREGLGKLWDSVDNRMGQLVYDNVFWDHRLKDALMATVRSVGWNLGTFRELGGGALDIKNIPKDKALTDRTAYLIALPLVASIYGAVTNYAMTGEAPKDMKDAFYPRTGATRPDGSPDRVSLPSYMKDVFAYGEDIHNFGAYGADPTQTLQNKAHPLISTVSQMLANKDFFGGAIRNPADSMVQQMIDEAAYLRSQASPFSIRNYLQQAKLKGEEPTAIGYLTSPSMVGIVPAPGYITKSPEQLESAQVSRMRDPLIQKYREAIKNGMDPEKAIPEMIKGGLSRRDIRYVLQSSRDTPRPGRMKSFRQEED